MDIPYSVYITTVPSAPTVPINSSIASINSSNTFIPLASILYDLKSYRYILNNDRERGGFLANDKLENIKPVNTRQLLHGKYKGINYRKNCEQSPHYLEFSDCTGMNISLPVTSHLLTNEMIDDFIEEYIIQDYPIQLHKILNGDFEIDVNNQKLVVQSRSKTKSLTGRRY